MLRHAPYAMWRSENFYVKILTRFQRKTIAENRELILGCIDNRDPNRAGFNASFCGAVVGRRELSDGEWA